MNRFAWVSASTISQAAAAASVTVADAMAASPGSPGGADTTVLKAGGVDLLDLLKENLLSPGTVVSLKQVPGLDTIVEEKTGDLRIGAMVTLATLADHAGLQRHYPALSSALRGSATPQIRNVATLGGNLLQRPRCWYFRSAEYHCLRKGGSHCFALADENQYHAIFDNTKCAIVHPSTAATALVALGAKVELTNADGVVRRVLLEDFFSSPSRSIHHENDLKPHEVLTAVLLPAPSPNARMAHLKQGEKDSFDWPLADVTVVIDLSPDGGCTSAAVILGAAAPVPYRATAAESLLKGKRIDENAASEAGRAAVAGATPLAGNGYKLPLFEALVRRAVLKAAAGG